MEVNPATLQTRSQTHGVANAGSLSFLEAPTASFVVTAGVNSVSVGRAVIVDVSGVESAS
jgi:hypothetical protein